MNVVKKFRMSGYGRPCKSHLLKLDLVQSGFSENMGLTGVPMFVGSNRAPSRLSHGNLSCNKSGSFKLRVNTDFLIGYNYKGVTQGTCFCLSVVAFVMMFPTHLYNRPQNSILTVS